MAVSLSSDAAQMATYLSGLTQPDTLVIRQAESALKPILKRPECVPAMIEVIKARDAQDEATRHVAAIVLRKRISGHLGRFDVPTKSALKTELLSILRTETSRPVRNGVVALVASVSCRRPRARGTRPRPRPAGRSCSNSWLAPRETPTPRRASSPSSSSGR